MTQPGFVANPSALGGEGHACNCTNCCRWAGDRRQFFASARPESRREASDDLPRHAADAYDWLSGTEPGWQVAALHPVDAGLEGSQAADRHRAGLAAAGRELDETVDVHERKE